MRLLTSQFISGCLLPGTTCKQCSALFTSSKHFWTPSRLNSFGRRPCLHHVACFGTLSGLFPRLGNSFGSRPRLHRPVGGAKTSADGQEARTNCACVSDNNSPYQQAAVVCIRNSKEATTGRQTA